MAKWIFLGLLVSVAIYILRRGDVEERVAFVTLLSAYVATYAIMVLHGGYDWLLMSPLVALVDTFAFAILLMIALRSKRFWPLPVAAFHIPPILMPVVTLLGEGLVSHSIGVTQGLWSYLQLFILAWATLRSQALLRPTTSISSAS
jgi:hypothetical protein